MNPTICPEPEFLKRFLLGALPVQEIESCQEHLSVCDPCMETVNGLKVDDTFTDLARQAWMGSAKRSSDESVSDHEVVGKMMLQIGQWEFGKASTSEPNQGQPNDDRAAEVQRLLGPPIGPNELGKLAHFRIVKLLGSGSTGVVYLASDTRLDRSVVLKVLRPSLGPAARKRFTAEAKSTAAIDHSNVVTIYEVGTDGPLAYIAMQWLPGQTLEQKLAVTETLDLDETRRVAIQIASGLAEAHSHGLIHRDIKPANIWIADGPSEVKILDFGLVRITDEDPKLTCTGIIAGTPCYMSPEQSRGETLDPRSDLFSLGCLMYQSLAGRLPFRCDNALATLRSIQQDQPTPLGELDPSIPDEMADLVMCLLEKSPNRRPPSAQAVVKALESNQDDWEFEVRPAINRPDSSPRRQKRFAIWKTIAAMIAAGLIGVTGTMYGQQIIRIITNQGEIEIETNVDDIKIEFLQEGNVVRVIDLATQQSIEIKAGLYEIRPVGEANSISIDRNRLVLSRGEKQIVKITRTGSGTGLPADEDPTISYRLRSGDVLGIFIEGVLGEFNASPPVHYPPPESGLPPAIGFPILVEYDGKISLPLIASLNVVGKTIDEVRNELNAAYKKGAEPILRDDARIMVSMIRQRGSKAKTLGSKNALENPSDSSQEQPESIPDKNPIQDPSPISQFQALPSQQESELADSELKQFEERYRQQQTRFERSEITRVELLESEAAMLEELTKNMKSTLLDVNRLRRLVEIRTEQFDLLSELDRSAEKDKSDAEFEQQCKSVREALAYARNRLTLLEESTGTTLTLPIYDGKTYEQLLAIVRTERDLSKLNPALKGIANLASKNEQPEMLDAVMQIARRGVGIANEDESKEFVAFIEQLFQTLNLDTLADLFINELATGTDNSRKFFFVLSRFGLEFRRELQQELTTDEDKALTVVNRVLKALEEFASTETRLDSSFNFLSMLRKSVDWHGVKLSENPSVKKMSQMYYDQYLVKYDLFDSQWSALLIEIIGVNPELTGLSARVEDEMQKLIARLEQPVQSSDLYSAQQLAKDIDALFRISQAFPDNIRPTEQQLDLANAALKYYQAYKDKGQSRSTVGTLCSILSDYYGVDGYEVQRAIYSKSSGTPVRLKLKDGKFIITTDSPPEDQEND